MKAHQLIKELLKLDPETEIVLIDTSAKEQLFEVRTINYIDNNLLFYNEDKKGGPLRRGCVISKISSNQDNANRLKVDLDRLKEMKKNSLKCCLLN